MTERTSAHVLLYEELIEDDPPLLAPEHDRLARYESAFTPEQLAESERRGITHKLTPEERAEIEREIAEKGFKSLCRCTPADFKDDEEFEARTKKAVMVNLYFEYGGDWSKVFQDARAVDRRRFAVFWRDEMFRAYIDALDPILMLEARGVVVEVMKHGLDEKARLAAALRFLEAKDPTTWDRGVRKQIVANKGSLESALFTRAISDDEFLSALIKDKLNKIPDNARALLEESLSAPRENVEASLQTVSGLIQTADISKLTDPFGATNEREGERNADEEI